MRLIRLPGTQIFFFFFLGGGVAISSLVRPGRVKPWTLKLISDFSFARDRDLEVRITRLLDMILKTEVPCRSRRGS
jgi:hypothetical protein